MDNWIFLLGGFIALILVILVSNAIYGLFGEGKRKNQSRHRKRGHNYRDTQREHSQTRDYTRGRERDRYEARERDYRRASAQTRR
ncbi:hypothetical protein [Dictyobacter vulcani]|nr:hypothetical protein [Dictyobacter vulcani]